MLSLQFFVPSICMFTDRIFFRYGLFVHCLLGFHNKHGIRRFENRMIMFKKKKYQNLENQYATTHLLNLDDATNI